jgi:hypothetical protein
LIASLTLYDGVEHLRIIEYGFDVLESRAVIGQRAEHSAVSPA